MSGGTMNHLCYSVEEAHTKFRSLTPSRRAFAKHLVKVAAALKAIEWNDSGDGCDGEDGLIRACLAKGDVLEATLEQAQIILEQLEAEIEMAK